MTSNVPELLPFIRTQFSKLKVVSPSDKVYKDECKLFLTYNFSFILLSFIYQLIIYHIFTIHAYIGVYSFDSPFSKTGLYVNITSLQGFGVSTVLSDVAKGGRLYLHEKWTKVPKPQPEGPIDAPKALAIIEDDKFDIIKEHSLMVFTGAGEEAHAVVLPNGELPEFVCNVLQSIIDHDGMKAKMTSGSWDPNDIRLESKYARNLVLLNNGIKISQDPKTWKCEESGDTQNLWLNLSTGYIGGGRKNWDGSGGSGAALKHFEATGSMYPLCVKLGTITANGADVWSYAPDEDCLVTDPLLAEHLSHWGIDIMKLEKTDKSMLEMEGDLNYSYDWSKMMEGSETMQSLNGPGYIGLQNIGSSCYLASVMQTVLSIPEVQERYLLNRENIIKSAPADPADDFATQFSKLAEGLLTDKYCPPPELMQAQPDAEVPEEYRIAPRMFKSCVAKGNSEFLSGRQQDASEYFMHFLQIMSRAERTALARIHTGTDPEIRAKQLLPTSSIFEFEVETRYQCSVTNQVKYTGGKSSVLNIIELRIPLEAATNKAEVEQFQESKKQKLDTVANTGNSTVSSTEEVKLQVPFQACLDTFFQEETVQFRNPTLGQSAPTSRRSRMSSFPRYLVVKLGRYYVGDNWVQVKVDAK